MHKFDRIKIKSIEYSRQKTPNAHSILVTRMGEFVHLLNFDTIVELESESQRAQTFTIREKCFLFGLFVRCLLCLFHFMRLL